MKNLGKIIAILLLFVMPLFIGVIPGASAQENESNISVQVNLPPVILRIEFFQRFPTHQEKIGTILNGGGFAVDTGILLDPNVYFSDDGLGDYFEFKLYDPYGNLICYGKGSHYPEDYTGRAFSCDNPSGGYGFEITERSYGIYKGTLCDSPGNCANIVFTLAKKQETICKDSDGGKNYYEIGSVTYGDPQNPAVNTDYCKDKNTLVEHYCDDSTYKSIEYKCPNGCYNGACVYETQVNITNITENQPPIAYIDTIDPNPATLEDVISFSGHGKDIDGYITSYKWDTSDGKFLSYLQSFSIPASYLGEGVHKIQFRVVDNENAVSKSDVRDLIIKPIVKFSIRVNTDKYSYTAGEPVKITATLTSPARINLDQANVTACVSLLTPTLTISESCTQVDMEPVGWVQQVCKVEENGSVVVCPTGVSYTFSGYYEIPKTARVGTYLVDTTAELNNVQKTAKTKFEVYTEEVPPEFPMVDVSLRPDEQTTVIGKPVEYKIIIQDKHGTAMEGSTPYYTYNIEVSGLPYNTKYPEVVRIASGHTKTVPLLVYPSATKTAVVKEEVSKIEGSRGIVVSKTAKSTPVREITRVTGAQIAVEPVEEVEEEAVPIERGTFRFRVKVTQTDDWRNTDSTAGILHVKYAITPTPPPFPPEGEEVTIELESGWNLINFPGRFKKLGSTCGEPYGFVYLPEKKKYLTIQEAIKMVGEEKLKNYLSTHSFWIYTKRDCQIDIIVEDFASYSGLSLFQGWNLLGATKDMVGETLSSINDNCVFERIYTWDAAGQKWVHSSESTLIEEPYKGILVKTSNACNLKTNIIMPPAFPEEPVVAPEEPVESPVADAKSACINSGGTWEYSSCDGHCIPETKEERIKCEKYGCACTEVCVPGYRCVCPAGTKWGSKEEGCIAE